MSRARDIADGTFSGAFSADSPTFVVDDTNNRVGIGTASPTSEIHAASSSTSVSPLLTLQNTNTGAYGSGISFRSYGAASYGDFETARISTLVGVDDGYLLFSTANNDVMTEAARINSNGTQTLNATHTSGYSLTITNSASSGVPEGIDIVNSGISVDSTAGHFIRCNDSTTTRCVVDLNGSLRNHDNSYGGISDERAKQDIVDAASQWDDIKAIQVRKYKKTVDVEAYGDDAQLEIGVIAQEFEASGMGGLVNTPDNPDEMKSVKYSILYMKAVKALQEAMERIESLEARVATLETV